MPMKYLNEKLLLLVNKFVHINENRVLPRRPVPMGDAERLVYCGKFCLSSAVVCSYNSLLQCVGQNPAKCNDSSSLSLSLSKFWF